MATVRVILVALAVIFIVPAIVVRLFIRRLSCNSDISLKDDLRRSLVRGLSILPISCIRLLRQPPDLDFILTSKRFAKCAEQLCVKVSADTFSGYWVCQGPPGRSQRPRESDMVLLWLHGGAYCLGSALGHLLTLLRVAEMMKARGISASIFAVEYTLAPEGRFPRQQHEAIAAYRYLLETEMVDPDKVIIIGESAGAHLGLACLIGLAERNLRKPAAAVLLCPWVNLKNSGGSFERNKDKDILTKDFLDRCVKLAVGGDRAQDPAHDGLVEFTEPLRGGLSWKRVLPSQTWINVGSHDVFFDDIMTFIDRARADEAPVELDITEGMPHGWHSNADKAMMQEYCDVEPEKEVPARMMPGSENIAVGLMAVLGRGMP